MTASLIFPLARKTVCPLYAASNILLGVDEGGLYQSTTTTTVYLSYYLGPGLGLRWDSLGLGRGTVRTLTLPVGCLSSNTFPTPSSPAPLLLLTGRDRLGIGVRPHRLGPPVQ
jgi:hypothetical protein